MTDKDDYSKLKEEWRSRERFALTPIHVAGLKGMVHVECRFPPETGERTVPYLYYTNGDDVAEITVETTPKLLRGRADDMESVCLWISLNLVALVRHWNEETCSAELLKELRAL